MQSCFNCLLGNQLDVLFYYLHGMEIPYDCNWKYISFFFDNDFGKLCNYVYVHCTFNNMDWSFIEIKTERFMSVLTFASQSIITAKEPCTKEPE